MKLEGRLSSQLAELLKKTEYGRELTFADLLEDCSETTRWDRT
jgi:hypothetical protein